MTLTGHDPRTLLYPPIVSKRCGKVVGVEMADPWSGAQRQACRDVNSWTTEHPDRARLVLTITIGDPGIRDPGLVQEVERLPRDTGLPSSQLRLEISEALLMHDPEWSAQLLEAIHRVGVSVSVDAFGDGYSSLMYLRRFALDNIKISGALVKKPATDDKSIQIVDAIVHLAHTLGSQASADGVSSSERVTRWDEIGCRTIQGPYVSRPLTASQFLEFWEVHH